MRTISEAKKQLLENLTLAGFPAQTMAPHRFDPEDPSPDLEMAMALLCVGLYPNVCYHEEKRRVLTTESKAALIHKTSVNCSQHISFPYPFFVFGEKIRTRAVSCKQMSMVTPIQLLLFGCKKVEWNNGSVRIDDWLNLEMDPCDAAMILALRPCLQDLLVRISADPEEVKMLDEKHYTMLKVVRDLCAFRAGDFQIDRPKVFGSNTYNRKLPRMENGGDSSGGPPNRYMGGYGGGYSGGVRGGRGGGGGRGCFGGFGPPSDDTFQYGQGGNNFTSSNSVGGGGVGSGGVGGGGVGGFGGPPRGRGNNYRYFNTGGNDCTNDHRYDDFRNRNEHNNGQYGGSGGFGGGNNGGGYSGHSGSNQDFYRYGNESRGRASGGHSYGRRGY